MEEIMLPAPAKINLALDIEGVRTDGYHIVKMIMQTVGLCDLITIKKTEGGIRISSTDDRLPEGKSNLAYKAAEILLKESGVEGGVEIHIEKKIPLAAGLAGGSTDAAAVLKGVNELFQLGFKNNFLKEIGSEIGSDVPFCLRGGTALAFGRGEQIDQLPDLEKLNLVLVTPPIEVSTARVYQEYDLSTPGFNIPVSKLVKLIEKKHVIVWDEGWGNILEPVTSSFVSDISEIKQLLSQRGVKFSLMSGSGPSVFGIVDDFEQAEFICKNWPRQRDFVYPTRVVKQDFKDLWRIYDIE